MRTVSIINQKGGVSKTTTTNNLAWYFYNEGLRVLLVDLDPQYNLTDTNGLTPKDSVKKALEKPRLTRRLVTRRDNAPDALEGSANLAGAELYITGDDMIRRLQLALWELDQDYDLCFIDTPPALGILTVNALKASDSVILPCFPDLYSFRGLQGLQETIQAVNPGLKVDGILLSRYNPRTKISKQFTEALESFASGMGTRLLDTRIRECTALTEANSLGLCIFDHKPTCNGARDYTRLATELDDIWRG